MTYETLKRMATDAEILFSLRDHYDCVDINLVSAYCLVRENEPIFSDMCDRLQAMRVRNRVYGKLLEKIVEQFPMSALELNLEIDFLQIDDGP